MPISPRQFLWPALAYASYAVSQLAAATRVDDSQAFSDACRYGIQYGPGWTQSGSPDSVQLHYQGTYTSTHTGGSYAMLSFQGTGISYNADKGPDGGITLLAIDGEQLPALSLNSSSVEHQQAISTLSRLAPGDHQIVVGTKPEDVIPIGVVGLDFFGVTPLDGETSYLPRNLGPGAWTVPANAIIVDDGDASIQYSEAWKLYEVSRPGPNPLFFNLTQHTSGVPGSSLNFTFHGTGVWYFSDDFPSNADVVISVDGGEGDLVRTYSGVSWVSQRLYWTRSGLPAGEHVVTVTHAGQPGQPANLDFFMYMPSPSTPESHLSKPIHARIGAIVGGTIGGAVGLGLIVAVLLLAYRRYVVAPKDEHKAAKTVETSVHHLTLAKRKSRESQATFDEEKVQDKVNTV